MTLNLEIITEDGKQLFKKVDPGTYRLGREQDNDIVIDSPSISRTHGLLCAAGTIWYYKDLGSTNGSWINEIEVAQDGVTPVLAGDFLQLGDTLFQVSYSESPYLGKFIVAVFQGAELLKEVTVYEGDTVIGNDSESDIPIQAGGFDITLSVGETALSVENRSTAKITLNGNLCPKISNVHHGDIIEIPDDGYFLIIVDARKRASQSKRAQASIVDWQLHASQYREKKTAKAESKPELFSPVNTRAFQPIAPPDAPVQSFRPRRDTTVMRRDDIFDFGRMTDSEKQVLLLCGFFIVATVLLFILYFIFF